MMSNNLQMPYQHIVDHLPLKEQLEGLQTEIEEIVVDFLRFIKSEKIDVSIAPESTRLNNSEETL